MREVGFTYPIRDHKASPLEGVTQNRRLTPRSAECNIDYTMYQKLPITDLLRKTINDSTIPFLRLEKETGVLRQTLMKFARGETSIHLDSADKLADFFGLELRPATKSKSKQK